MADQKLTELTAISASELEDLLYMVEDPSGTPASGKVSASQFFKDNFKVISLTDASLFATALTNVGNNGIVIIDANETLAASSYTIPIGVTLYGRGGVLTMASGTTMVFRGRINSNVQILAHSDYSNRGDLQWKSTQAFELPWFGWDTKDNSATAQQNHDAWTAVWVDTREKNNLHSGSPIRIPPGNYDMKLFSRDTAGQSHFDIGIIGDGGMIWLADNEDTALFDFTGGTGGSLKETSVQRLRVDGNKANNTLAAGNPLLDFGVYNLTLFDVHVQNSPADGIRVKSFQQANLINVECESCTGWGIVLDNYINMQVYGCTAESNGVGGMLVISPASGRHSSTIIDGLYCENTPIALELRGTQFVQARNIHCDTTNTALKLSQDSGTGNYSLHNYIDLTSTEGGVTIDDGCHGNTIIINPEFDQNEITDSDGRNRIIKAGAQGFELDFHEAINSGTALITDSNPAESTSSNITRESGTVHPIPPAASWRSASNDVVHAVQNPSANLGVDQVTLGLTASPGAGTYYWQLIIDSDHNARVYIEVLDNNLTHFYLWDTKTFGASGTTRLYLPTEQNRPKLFEVPVVIDTGGRAIFLRCWTRSLGTSSPKMHYYYAQFSATARMKPHYIKGSTAFGAGNRVEYSNAGRPTASEVPDGAEIWNTDDNAWNVSDGSDWRDMAGNVT